MDISDREHEFRLEVFNSQGEVLKSVPLLRVARTGYYPPSRRAMLRQFGRWVVNVERGTPGILDLDTLAYQPLGQNAVEMSYSAVEFFQSPSGASRLLAVGSVLKDGDWEHRTRVFDLETGMLISEAPVPKKFYEIFLNVYGGYPSVEQTFLGGVIFFQNRGSDDIFITRLEGRRGPVTVSTYNFSSGKEVSRVENYDCNFQESAPEPFYDEKGQTRLVIQRSVGCGPGENNGKLPGGKGIYLFDPILQNITASYLTKNPSFGGRQLNPHVIQAPGKGSQILVNEEVIGDVGGFFQLSSVYLPSPNSVNRVVQTKRGPRLLAWTEDSFEFIDVLSGQVLDRVSNSDWSQSYDTMSGGDFRRFPYVFEYDYISRIRPQWRSPSKFSFEVIKLQEK
jgi:hypothetical protein